MELKNMVLQFLKQDGVWEERKDMKALSLKACSFPIGGTYFDVANDQGQYSSFPLLVTDGFHHIGAYFTHGAASVFSKKYKKMTLLDLQGAILKVTRWNLELTDVPPLRSGDPDEGLTEKYTSYIGNEVRLVIHSFSIQNKQPELLEGFSDNLHWDTDIKLEIARMRHFALQEAAKFRDESNEIIKLRIKPKVAEAKVVDLLFLLNKPNRKKFSSKSEMSCFSLQSNFIPDIIEKVFKFVPNKSVVAKRKSKYLAKKLASKDGSKGGAPFIQHFKIRSTRNLQSHNYEAKEEEDIVVGK
jgi:hypothetical protein